jgi:hypothetical protein
MGSILPPLRLKLFDSLFEPGPLTLVLAAHGLELGRSFPKTSLPRGDLGPQRLDRLHQIEHPVLDLADLSAEHLDLLVEVG